MLVNILAYLRQMSAARQEKMSRSYRKTPQSYPAHCKRSDIGKLSWKKTHRREVNNCCDSDGTPILPAKVSMGWPLSHGGGLYGLFGHNSYHKWVYNLDVAGGKLVSTLTPEEELYPGYAAKQLRMYRNK